MRYYLLLALFLFPFQGVLADYSITTYDSVDSTLNFRGLSPFIATVAQSFLTISNENFVSVTIDAGANVGSPSGFVVATLYTDSGGSPSTTSLGSKQFTWVQNSLNIVTFDTPISLISSSLYWVVLTRTSPNGSNYFRVNIDQGDFYTDGQYKYCAISCSPAIWTFDSGSWDLAMILNFESLPYEYATSTAITGAVRDLWAEVMGFSLDDTITVGRDTTITLLGVFMALLTDSWAYIVGLTVIVGTFGLGKRAFKMRIRRT